MDTLCVVVGALHPEPQHGRRGLPSDAICWDFNAPDAIPGVVGGCRFYNASGESELNGLAAFALRAVPGWGRAHAQSVRRLWGHALHVGAIGERLPNRDSRVDLDPDARDRFGMPVARIASFLDRARLARCASWRRSRTSYWPRAARTDFRELFELGLVRRDAMSSAPAGWGTIAKRSVVDAFGRSHRWRNLWIADASVFPSSGGGKNIPQLFVGSGASKFADIAQYPQATMGVQGPFRYEARLYARYALAKNPNAKFAVISQNDDFGRDYLSG